VFLSGRQIVALGLVTPCRDRFKVQWGNYQLSGGIDHTSYGLTLGEGGTLYPNEMKLFYTAERLSLPARCQDLQGNWRGLVGWTVNKSTLARVGLWQANTDMEAGWSGHLTLEIMNVTAEPFTLDAGMPITTARFGYVEEPVSEYDGKYQNQAAMPIAAR
jgi:deoxycytidine triphosphate deaminase